MYWPNLDALTEQISALHGVTITQLGRADIPAVCETLVSWYPSIGAGTESDLTQADYYESEVALAHEPQTVAARPCVVFLLRDATGLRGYNALEYYDTTRTLCSRMMVVDPAARGQGLARVLAELQRALGQALHADHLLAFTELDNHFSRRGLERMGFWLCGIAADSDRKTVAGRLVYVPDAVYVLPLVALDALRWPSPETLTPRTARLMEHLFAERYAARPASPDGSPVPSLARLPDEPEAQSDLPPGEPGTWPVLDALAAQLAVPPGHTLTQLHGNEAPRLLARLASWIPSLSEGAQRHWLEPSRWQSDVASSGGPQRLAERPDYVAVLRRGEELVGCCCLSYRAAIDLTFVEVLAVQPERAGQGLEELLLRAALGLARGAGTRKLLAWAPTDDPTLQRACERTGFALSALVPAASRRRSAAGSLVHTFEALYERTLLAPEDSRWPDEAELPAHVAALRRLLFPSNPPQNP